MVCTALLAVTVSAVVVSAARGGERYFPKDSISEFEQKWYAEVLKECQAPSLLKQIEEGKTKNKTVYRFIYIPSFSHALSIRLEKSGDTITLETRQLRGRTRDSVGKLGKVTRVAVSQADYQAFRGLLVQADYFGLRPTNRHRGLWYWAGDRWGKLIRQTLDGQMWILEWAQDHQYYIVQRHSPNRRTSFAQACQKLADLAGLKIEGLNLPYKDDD